MANILFKRGPTAQNDDADDDVDQILRPAFAVSGEPTNEHAPPCDGFEYLRRVRKESNAMPAVVRASVEPPSPAAATAGPRTDAADGASRPPPPPEAVPAPLLATASLQPSREWQRRLLEDFGRLRAQLPLLRARARASGAASSWLPLPQRDADWHVLCFGAPLTLTLTLTLTLAPLAAETMPCILALHATCPLDSPASTGRWRRALRAGRRARRGGRGRGGRVTPDTGDSNPDANPNPNPDTNPDLSLHRDPNPDPNPHHSPFTLT